MRALGHKCLDTTKLYVGHEDEPLNIHKAQIPEGRVEKRIPRAKDSYVKPSIEEINLLVDRHIEENPKVIGKSTYDVAFFIGPSPLESEDKMAYRAYVNLRSRITRSVLGDHREKWQEEESARAFENESTSPPPALKRSRQRTATQELPMDAGT